MTYIHARMHARTHAHTHTRKLCTSQVQHWWAGIDVAPYPHVRGWLDRVGTRAAVQAGINTPGISVLGEGGATFAQLCSDEVSHVSIYLSIHICKALL